MALGEESSVQLITAAYTEKYISCTYSFFMTIFFKAKSSTNLWLLSAWACLSSFPAINTDNQNNHRLAKPLSEIGSECISLFFRTPIKMQRMHWGDGKSWHNERGICKGREIRWLERPVHA